MASNTSTFRIFENALATAVPGLRSVPFKLRYAVFRRTFYAPQHNFVYYRLPKCANSTVVMTLCSAMRSKDSNAPVMLDDAEAAVEAKAQAKRGLRAYALNGFSKRKPFAFTFVRDPRSRVLSCYLDKIVKGRAVYRHDLGTDQKPMSFLDFMLRLGDGYLTTNPHWAPQSDLIPGGHLDYAGRVENLQDDLQSLVDRLFGLADFRVVTKEVDRTNSADRLAEYFGPAEDALVRKLYARDFERFYPELL
jgi:dermatan 4-sulfotransferase 1